MLPNGTNIQLKLCKPVKASADMASHPFHSFTKTSTVTLICIFSLLLSSHFPSFVLNSSSSIQTKIRMQSKPTLHEFLNTSLLVIFDDILAKLQLNMAVPIMLITLKWNGERERAQLGEAASRNNTSWHLSLPSAPGRDGKRGNQKEKEWGRGMEKTWGQRADGLCKENKWWQWNDTVRVSLCAAGGRVCGCVFVCVCVCTCCFMGLWADCSVCASMCVCVVWFAECDILSVVCLSSVDLQIEAGFGSLHIWKDALLALCVRQRIREGMSFCVCKCEGGRELIRWIV